MSKGRKLRIGITPGDCAGIGPEIVDLALASGRVPKSADYVVIGRRPKCQPAKPTLETAQAAAAALEEAVTLARRGELDGVVTGPIHKARMYQAGFKFPGQTEFFADRCGVKNFAMCLNGGKITVALVTTHIPLSKVPRVLKRSEIVRVAEDVRFEALLPESCNNRPVVASISFFASGLSCGGVIALTHVDASYEIRINWLTGRIEVVPRDRFNNP